MFNDSLTNLIYSHLPQQMSKKIRKTALHSKNITISSQHLPRIKIKMRFPNSKCAPFRVVCPRQPRVNRSRPTLPGVPRPDALAPEIIPWKSQRRFTPPVGIENSLNLISSPHCLRALPLERPPGDSHILYLHALRFDTSFFVMVIP